MARPFRLPHLLALALPLAACAPPPSSTPAGGATIRVGQTLRDRLEPGDRPAPERPPMRAYGFYAQSGQRLVATLESADFDTYLVVARLGAVQDTVRTGGPAVEGIGPRVRFTVPETGNYLLVVQAMQPQDRGVFTLSLQAAPAATTGGVRGIALGDRVRGELQETDENERVGPETVFYDAYRFTGRAGQRVEIEMDSDSFDTVVTLGRMRGAEYVPLEENDDGSSDRTGSLLMYILPEDGEYVIRATSFSEATGPYLLELRAWAEAPVMTLYAGQQEEAFLDVADRSSEGAFYDAYHYAGRAGERVRIRMDSDDFDAALVLGRMRGGEFEALASIDDGGGGTNARLDAVLPADGEYIVRATSFGARQTGAYRILLTSLPR
ncbi:MAG TPA: PPC domain-containing protein [Longimicrobium sp.]|nr:PPC domain-containing protein [Longimicrobium sp.]